MSEKKEKRVYCTNMEENDPIIEKLMQEYLQEKAESGQEVSPSDLIVNFDISYPDGSSKNHTCGSEGYIFGDNEENYIDRDIDPEEMKNYYGDKEDILKEEECESTCSNREELEDKICDENYSSYFKDEKCDIEKDNTYSEYYEEEDLGKWLNCEDEWTECNKNSIEDICKEEKKIECERVKKVEGKICVYSVLGCKEGTRIKGVKVNLYRLNGITPELISSKITDCDGKVVFSNIAEGAYRIIQLIDKRYFEKPRYVNWNEVTIDCCNKESTIYVINIIKINRCCK